MSRKDSMEIIQEKSICDWKDINNMIMFTLGDSVESSAITSLFQAIFGNENPVNYFLALSCDEQTLEDKIKNLLCKYKYPSKISNSIVLDSLCAFFPKDLKHFGSSPIQVLEFIIDRLKSIRHLKNSNKPESVFSFGIKGAVTFKLLSSRLKSAEDWSFCIEEELGSLKTSSILLFQIDWNRRPSNANISLFLRYIPLEIQHRGNYNLKSFIAFNGCFYYSFLRVDNKWVLFEEYTYKANLRWLEVVWILANRIMYPILLNYEKIENYKEIKKNMTEIDWDKLKRFSIYAENENEHNTRLWIERIHREKSYKSYMDEKSNLCENNELRCKQCLSLIENDEYRCIECRAVNWNKFYEKKSKENRALLSDKRTENCVTRNELWENNRKHKEPASHNIEKEFLNRKETNEGNIFSFQLAENNLNTKTEISSLSNLNCSQGFLSNATDDSNQNPQKLQPLRSQLSWTCHFCNFQNSLKLFICSVCQKPRTTEAHQEILSLIS